MSGLSYHNHPDELDFLDDPAPPPLEPVPTRELIEALYIITGCQLTGDRLPLRLRLRVGSATPDAIRSELRYRSANGVGVCF